MLNISFAVSQCVEKKLKFSFKKSNFTTKFLAGTLVLNARAIWMKVGPQASHLRHANVHFRTFAVMPWTFSMSSKSNTHRLLRKRCSSHRAAPCARVKWKVGLSAHSLAQMGPLVSSNRPQGAPRAQAQMGGPPEARVCCPEDLVWFFKCGTFGVPSGITDRRLTKICAFVARLWCQNGLQSVARFLVQSICFEAKLPLETCGIPVRRMLASFMGSSPDQIFFCSQWPKHSWPEIFSHVEVVLCPFRIKQSINDPSGF